MHVTRDKNTKGDYTLIVPALDRTGPVNVAVDIGLAAHNAGWRVRFLFLTAIPPRDDLQFADEVRQFRWSDVWKLRGVVHTHCLRPDLLGLVFALNRHITRITTLHNFFLFDVSFDKPRCFVVAAWQLWRSALRTFDVVVCISEAMRRYYRRSLPGQSLDLAYNFRGASPATPPSPASLAWIGHQKADGRMVLAFVGSLSERKNVVGLVSALANAPTLALIICGQGPLRGMLGSVVQRLGLQDRVRLEGQVLAPSNIVRHTDALILPSYAEGFPLAVLEAASVGVPVLLSNITVHRELARLGFGLTFDHRRFSDLDRQARALKTTVPAPSQILVDLWLREFTPQAGFARYETLITRTQKSR